MRKLVSALMICSSVAFGASSSQSATEINIAEGLWDKCLVQSFDQTDPFIATHHEAFQEALPREHSLFMRAIEGISLEALRDILAFETMPGRAAYQKRIDELSAEIRNNKDFIATTFELRDRVQGNLKEFSDRWPLSGDTYIFARTFVIDTSLEMKSDHLLNMILSYHEDDLDASFVAKYKDLCSQTMYALKRMPSRKVTKAMDFFKWAIWDDLSHSFPQVVSVENTLFEKHGDDVTKFRQYLLGAKRAIHNHLVDTFVVFSQESVW